MAFTFYYGFEDFVYFYDIVLVVQLIFIESLYVKQHFSVVFM